MNNVRVQKHIDWVSSKNKILYICMYIVFILVVPCTANSAVFNVPSGNVAALIDAINDATLNDDPDTIILEAGTYTLTEKQFGSDNGLPSIFGPVDIIGQGQTTTIIERDPQSEPFRIFETGFKGVLTLEGVTVRGGSSNTFGGGVLNSGGTTNIINSSIRNNFADFDGGGVHISGGTINITNSTICDNTAEDFGGGVAVGFIGGGIINITNSTICRNTASFRGGGIYNQTNGTINISSSTIIDNGADSGGGIHNFGVMIINDSNISGNSAEFGGGVNNQSGQLTITNSTISDNIAFNSGGVDNVSSVMTITNSTISGNEATDDRGGLGNINSTLHMNNVTIAFNIAADRGGGILNAFPPSTINLKNTLIADNIALRDLDCFGTLTSQGYNLIQTVSQECAIVGETTGNLVGVDPLLGPLTNNGGSTETHALSPNSPAIDAGNPAPPGSGGNACEATDQRGVPRNCDIGAFELVLPPPPPPPDVSQACDANGSGTITAADVTALINDLRNRAPATGNADCNGSGTVTAADVTALINVLRGRTQPPM